MKNEKSFRNPFPWIWKVYKYEMKSSARILLPVYITTIAVALSTMMLVATAGGMPDSSFNMTDPLDEVTFFTAVLFFGMCFVAPVITIIILSKRFKTGLLGDEAYMNLMFPVTVGEHLCGRILSVIIWFFVCLVTELLSFLMFYFYESKIDWGFFVKFWNEFPFLMIMTFFMALVLFIYFVNSIAHLAKKHRTIVKVVTVTVMLSFVFRIIVAISDLRIVSEEYVFSLFFAALSVIYAVVTYFILKYRLNLE